jgi:hypothetical protein
MKCTLDDSIVRSLGSLNGLRAVVLSVAPDGLIAWCWSREHKPEIALGFAALDRAATICLEGLGASQQSRNLLLTAQDAWVASWPLDDTNDHKPGRARRGRLVLTTVFDGELLTGMVMVYGIRVRAVVRAALDAAREPTVMQLRRQIVDFVIAAPDPSVALRELAERSKLELRQLERLEQLSEAEQRRLEATVRCSTPSPGPNLSLVVERHA